MFSLYGAPSDTVTIILDGTAQTVPAGVSVAAAVLGAGRIHTRVAPVSGEPRAPYCLMGACYECLMEIDGQKDQQSCQVQVREGMTVNRQIRTAEEGR